MQRDNESRLGVFIELIFSVVAAKPGRKEGLDHTYKWQMNHAVAPESFIFCIFMQDMDYHMKMISGNQYPALIYLMGTN